MAKKIVISFLLGVLAVAAYYFFSLKMATAPEAETLPSQTSEREGIKIQAAGADFDIKKSVRFEITIDTHAGSLDFDLAEISTLEDDLGNQYSPTAWEGSAPGGHHRSGTLVFPGLKAGTGYLTLLIKDNPDLEPRSFEWDLKQ